MSTPSLQMTPTAYKEGKLYSVLPTSGVGDFTVSRNSKATRVNQDGFIEEVDENVPRLDYTDGGCPVLLTEPQSTNLITYSQDFSNASWNKIDSSITANFAISPDGTQNADYFSGSGFPSANQSQAISVGVNFTVSCYVKSAGLGNDTFRLFGCNNLISQNLTATDEWQRFSFSFTSTANTLHGINRDSSNNDFDLLIWGFQLEQLPYATSYIPTEGSTVTRLGDVVTDAGDASTFNSEEGVLYAEISSPVNDSTGDARQITISDGTSDNRVILGYSSNVADIFSAVVVNGSIVFQNNYSQDLTKSNKVALKYKANSFSLYINGIEVTTQTSGLIFSEDTLNTLNFGRPSSNSSNFYGKTKELKVFDDALSNSSLVDTTGFSSFIDMAQQFNYELI